MEIGSLAEFGPIAEEILNYLNAIFRIEPLGSVECVQQLLKSIFEMNLLVHGIDIVQDGRKWEKVQFVIQVSTKYYIISCRLSLKLLGFIIICS